MSVSPSAERVPLAVKMLYEGKTFVKIGVELGVSKQRAYQIIVRELGKDEIKRVWQMIREHKKEIKKLLLEQTCVICYTKFCRLSWIKNGKNERTRKTCSKRCSALYTKVMYHLNPQRKKSEQDSHARYAVRNPEKVPVSTLRWAQKRLGIPQEPLKYPEHSRRTSERKPWLKAERIQKSRGMERAMQEVEKLREQTARGEDVFV